MTIAISGTSNERLGTDGRDVIFAGPRNDRVDGLEERDFLFGQRGDDLVAGGPGIDVLSGGDGNDELFGGDEADRMNGGAGDDRLWPHFNPGSMGSPNDATDFAPGGNDIASGGSGDDQVRTVGPALGAPGSGPIYADGGSGDDEISGSIFADFLVGGTGADMLSGRENDDALFGGDGDDQLSWGNTSSPFGTAALFGGDGKDILLGGTANANVLDGGTGDDVIRLGLFGVAEGPVAVDGGSGLDTLILPRGFQTFDLRASSGRSISGIERIDMDAPVPGSEQDTAGGPPADNPVLILDRDSVLRISDKSDILRIDGGSDDVVHAIGDWQRSGDKSIEGRTYVRYELDGATLLVAQAITVEIAEPSQNANVPSPPPGTPHADDLTGTDGDDVFFAGAGDDTVSGGGGTDLLFGQADNDLIDGGDGDDMLSGGEGNDEIYSGDGFDRIDGGAGDDVIWANTMRTGFAELGRSPDHVSGGSGNDTIAMAAIGGERPVPLIADGGSGDDIINGGNADDVLFGGSGNDRIVGVEGNDFIDGGDGDDELIWTGGIAPTGEAAMFGGDGDDRLSGGTSNAAVMDGGNGSDVIVAGVFAAPGGLEAFDGGAGFDTLDLRLRLVQSETIDLTDPEGFGGALSGFERIDMGVPMSANDAEAAPVDDPALIVDRESVLRMSDETDTLVVDGGSDDQVRAIGNWQRAGEVYGDDRIFVRYELGDAVLLIASGIATSVEADLCGCG